jgi:hypothetical protein
MKKNSLSILLCMLIGIGLYACGGDGDTPEPPGMEKLVGTWARPSQGYSLTLASNLTYTGEFTGDGVSDVSGHYSTRGIKIFFTDTGGSLSCSDNENFIVGSYTYSISGNSMIFSRQTDTCAGRAAILTGGAWTR